jgi:hypothetical protein
VPDEDRKKIVTGDYAHDRFVSELVPDLRETIAKAIHEAYRHAWRGKVRNIDLSIAKWDKLPDYLKESNRQQADHMFDKLHRIGCTVRKVTDRDIVLMTFTEDEIEIMAEMEHTRWNEERLRDGWRWGKKRDIIKKTSPYLVGWSELLEDVKERDRQTVRKIPEFLAKVRLEIQRQFCRQPSSGETR